MPEKKTWNYGFGLSFGFMTFGMKVEDDKYYLYATGGITGTEYLFDVNSFEPSMKLADLTSMECQTYYPMDYPLPDKISATDFYEKIKSQNSDSLGDATTITSLLTMGAQEILGTDIDGEEGISGKFSDKLGFLPTANYSNGRTVARTVDSAGNTVDTGSMVFTNAGAGVGDFGVSVSSTTTRIGGVTKTSNQAKLNFKFINFSFGR